jgi:hypothetical protein
LDAGTHQFSDGGIRILNKERVRIIVFVPRVNNASKSQNRVGS